MINSKEILKKKKKINYLKKVKITVMTDIEYHVKNVV